MFDGVDEVDVFDLLDELERIAGGAAAEAAVPAHLLADVERRCSLGVERAEADPVAAHPSERRVLLDHVGDRNRCSQPFEILVDNRHGREATGGTSSPPEAKFPPRVDRVAARVGAGQRDDTRSTTTIARDTAVAMWYQWLRII